MPRRSATVRGRGLGIELQRLRRRAALSCKAAGEQLGWSASKVSRLETGHRGITSEDVSALLVVYGITGAERDRLLGMAQRADEPGWWATGDQRLTDQSRMFLNLESGATSIADVELTLVPGLLQTPEYVRALMVAAGVPDQDIEPRVARRLGRQAILSRERPPRLHAILDEAVLRRAMGGAEVMARQLRHLIDAARRPHIAVQVVPFAVGGHAAIDGSFVLLEFDSAPSVVHLEGKSSGLFLERGDEVAAYTIAVEQLRALALSEDESRQLIEQVAVELE